MAPPDASAIVSASLGTLTETLPGHAPESVARAAPGQRGRALSIDTMPAAWARKLERDQRLERRQGARSRRRRQDLVVAVGALVTSLLALPISLGGPEAASVLAVAAITLAAGQRWAIGLVLVAEVMLLPGLLPRAFSVNHHQIAVTIAAQIGLLGLVPGLLAMRRGAAALALLSGWRTQRVCRGFQIALIALGVASCVPLI